MQESDVYDLAYKMTSAIAEDYGAEPLEMAMWLTAIAKTESGFNPGAKNKNSTARGLMQLLICTQREVEKKYAKVEFAPAMYNCSKQYPQETVPEALDKMFDAVYAMKIAAHYLGYQFRRYGGKWDKVIHAYNQGSYPGSRKSDGKKYLAIVKNNTNDTLRLLAKIKNNTLVKEYY